MGDRVSIAFRKEGETSVALFHHWAGEEFPQQALKYAKELRKDPRCERGYPLGRLEPSTVMVDFIRHITKGMGRIKSSLYLGRDGADGDNKDNGHWIIDLDNFTATKVQGS